MNSPFVSTRPPKTRPSQRGPVSAGLLPVLCRSSVLECPAELRAQVQGRWPDWLRGRLVRSAPALFETAHWQARHWFDGLGQLYAFEFDGAGAVHFRQRLIESDFARQAHSGAVTLASFGSGSGRGWLQRLVQPVPVATDNANVSVWPMGDDWVAMSETDRQLRVDPQSLRTLGPVVWDDTLPAGLWMTAHPQWDPVRRVCVNIGTEAGPRAALLAFEHEPGRARRRLIGRWPTPRLLYVHAFGLSPRQVCIVAHPFDVNPARFLFSNRFIEHYRWRPHRPTRLVIIDRHSAGVRVVECEPMFVFHTVHQRDVPDGLDLDVLAYPDPQVLTEGMRTQAMQAHVPGLLPRLTRIEVRGERVRVQPLADAGFEFPSVDRRRLGDEMPRSTWGAALTGTASDPRSRVVGVNTHTGTAMWFEDGEHLYGEPVFVPRPDGRTEGDGVLLTVGASTRRAQTRLQVLDALTLNLVASACVDALVPLGFHGSFETQRLPAYEPG